MYSNTKEKTKKSVLGRRTSTTYVEEKCFNATKRKNIVCLRENVSILENYREVLQHNQENKLWYRECSQTLGSQIECSPTQTRKKTRREVVHQLRLKRSTLTIKRLKRSTPIVEDWREILQYNNNYKMKKTSSIQL